MTCFTIIVPEIIILFAYVNESLTISLVLNAVLLALGLMLFMKGLVQLSIKEMERFVIFVFFSFSALFFVILGHVEPLIIAGVAILFSYAVFIKSQYIN